MKSPIRVEVVGNFLALHWEDGNQSFIKASDLRAKSPSAEQSGEVDIFGNKSGGSADNQFPNIQINSFEFIGNYALRIRFSDGHSSGIYSWELLGSFES